MTRPLGKPGGYGKPLYLAVIELRLSWLADELQRTSRRLNALEHLLIPRLEAEAEFIQMA